MTSDIKNSEGYTDITPYAAMKSIEREAKKYRPLAYICSPYSGDIEANVKRTKEFCRYALDKGFIPLAPHLMFPQFMDDGKPSERELAMFMDMVLMGKCDIILVLGETISEGMKKEIDRAERRRKPVKYFNSKFEEIHKWK